MISGGNRPNEISYPKDMILDFHIILSRLLRCWEMTWMITHHPIDNDLDDHTTSNRYKYKYRCSHTAQRQFYMKDHIASMPTRPRKITQHPCRLLIVRCHADLLVEILLLSNRVWDLVYSYRHMVVRNIRLDEMAYEPILMRPRQVSPTRNPH